MSLFKYTTYQDLIRILQGSIRFTQPGAFNDPFEVAPELLVPENLEPTHITLSFSVQSPRGKPGVGELDWDFESDSCNDMNSRMIRNSLDKALGSLCLTRNRSSKLMWSHYAGAYSGAVIEVDSSHEFFDGYFDMNYQDHRPKKDLCICLSSDKPLPIAEWCVKPTEWQYEEEVRVVRNLSDCKNTGCEDARGYPVFVMDLPSECITSIALGERMPISRQRAVWNQVKDRDLSLYLEAISNWGYEFRREPIKLNGLKNPIISPRTAQIFQEELGDIGEVARWQLNRKDVSVMVNVTL